ncbi:MAG: 16S rRNA (guanine(527)-N(7))-methyltransferase RsmG [Pirellulales bacterium]
MPDATPQSENVASPDSLADSLAAALARHEIELPDAQVALLDRYCRLLWDWNEKLNLTRHTDYEKFVARDVVDSLALARLLEPKEKILDVGTGGGVPGVVLAIIRPDLSVTLTESVGKKARVVNEIVKELGLKTPVHHGRAEDLLARGKFNTLVARAVAPLTKLLTWFRPHWRAFERLLVIKGPAWVEERRVARENHLLLGLNLRKKAAYPIPGTDSETVVLEIRPS